MATVTQRISQVKQPRGGYINPRSLASHQLKDGEALGTPESVHSSISGAVVDYLTRLANGARPEDAFRFSLIGARNLDLAGYSIATDVRNALNALTPGVAPDAAAVVAACRLVRYEVAYRRGTAMYNPSARTTLDEVTIRNIQIMVNRALAFFNAYGPVTLDGFTFDGAFTDIVTAGDGDFLTADTLWDFKVSVNAPTKDHTLQLIMYYLMGARSCQPQFDGIARLGVFNPRLNRVFDIAIADIPADVVAEISRDVIGYR